MTTSTKAAKPITVTMGQSTTTTDGYPMLDFITPYGPMQVTFLNADKATIRVDRDRPFCVFGVPISGRTTVTRRPVHERAPENGPRDLDWTAISYGSDSWRRLDKNIIDDTISGAARRTIHATAIACVAESFRVRPDILKRAVLADRKADAAAARATFEQARKAAIEAEHAAADAEVRVLDARAALEGER